MIVGRDPRFLGETLVEVASEILVAHGITPVVADEAPTPAISYEVIRSRAGGAINFTASHNPPEYNGIKFSTSDGAPALPEVTKRIEAEIASAADNPTMNDTTDRKAERLDIRPPYLARLREIVDLEVIRKAHLKVAFDALWGAGRGYSDELLRQAGIEVAAVHIGRDVLFGGHAPEPDDVSFPPLEPSGLWLTIRNSRPVSGGPSHKPGGNACRESSCSAHRP